MSSFMVRPRGRYDLASAIGFLEGWPPTSADNDGRSEELRWSACLEGSWSPIEVRVTQVGDDLSCDLVGTAALDDVRTYVSRVLSVDVDGTGFDALEEHEPVAGRLIASSPGLRPVCFWSPYEAAAWGVMSQRSSMAQASRVKQRMTEELGVAIGNGRAFPAPGVLSELEAFRGLSSVKIGRLRAVAQAAREGVLDAKRLRSLETAAALEKLRGIDGIGPFTAELILVRGAGHPDVFPQHERRLHNAMREAYGRPDAGVDELASIASAWAPYRSWVSFLFRASVG